MACQRILRILQFAAIALLAVSLEAAEQRGIVKFGGLPLPGATVTATQGDKKLISVTDQNGVYTFKDLPDGAWTVQVEMLCFATIKQDMTINSKVPFYPTWDMKLLSFDEIKAAAAAAPPPTAPRDSPVVAVDTSVAPTPTDATAKPGTSLPNAPKVAAAPSAKPNAGFQRAAVNATGNTPSDAKPEGEAQAIPDATQGAAAEGFLVNGSSNNGAASPFSQSAAFGNNRNKGRGLYNGGIGFIADLSYLDAQSYSLNGTNTAKPDYSNLTGNASFGGPLKVARWRWLRNGPNVTMNYQWVHNRNVTTTTTLVPTAAQRAGDFSGFAPIFDPNTGLQFAGNIIPTARLNASPQARALLNYYPLPNFTSTTYNYQVPITGITHQDSFQSRFNQTVDNKTQLNWAFAFQHTRNDNDNIFNFLDKTNILGLTATIAGSRRLSSRLFFNAGYTFSRQSVTVLPFFANTTNVSGNIGINGNDQTPINYGPPGLNFSSGIAGLSDSRPAINHNETGALTAGLFWNHSPHNIRVGGDFRRQEFNTFSQQNPRGTFTFNGQATQSVVGGVGAANTGNDLADFLLGVPDTSSLAFGNADKYFRSNLYDAYVNDDWRINSALTLNAGLRWDYGSPISELYGRLVNLDVLGGANSPFSSIVPVVGNERVGTLTGRDFPRALLNSDKAGFQPRVAIAWRPLPASSLVVRAGYGVNYNTSVYNTIANQMAQQSPLSKSLNVSNSPTNPLTLANGFTAPPNTLTNSFAVDPNYRVGYAQSWNLSIQRDLPGSLLMTVTYLGIKGTRATQEFLPNTYPSGAANPCPNCPVGFAYLTSNGNSTRESGSVQLRRRLHNGFTASLNYTYSKSIDDASLGGRGSAYVLAQDWTNLSAERGLSPFDQRHLMNLQMQYSTGVGVAGGTLLNGWRGALYKDWTFVSNLTIGSGLPETPTDPFAVRGTGYTGSLRPEYTGASLYNAPSGYYLNSAAYAAPLPGQWGNAGRDSITGPSQFALNMSASRTFRLTDRLNADLRVDATNAINHVVYSAWNTTFGSPQFGLPTNANQMRRLQTTFRVRF